MTKRRKRHTPEQIIRKLREADAMLVAGRDIREKSPAWRSARMAGRLPRVVVTRLCGFGMQ